MPVRLIAGDARRWLQVFFVVLLGGVASVGGTNFLVNPLGYYPTHALPPITWSSRGLKLRLLSEAPPPEVLILGSSRSMKIAPRDVQRLSHFTAFNASVDSARVEDWYALLNFTLSRPGMRLQRVILAIDPEAFHDHVGP